MKRFLSWLFDSTPKVPDFVEPDRCFRCSAYNRETREHRPCFQVGCYCYCSQVKGWIA